MAKLQAHTSPQPDGLAQHQSDVSGLDTTLPRVMTTQNPPGPQPPEMSTGGRSRHGGSRNVLTTQARTAHTATRRTHTHSTRALPHTHRLTLSNTCPPHSRTPTATIHDDGHGSTRVIQGRHIKSLSSAHPALSSQRAMELEDNTEPLMTC